MNYFNFFDFFLSKCIGEELEVIQSELLPRGVNRVGKLRLEVVVAVVVVLCRDHGSSGAVRRERSLTNFGNPRGKNRERHIKKKEYKAP